MSRGKNLKTICGMRCVQHKLPVKSLNHGNPFFILTLSFNLLRDFRYFFLCQNVLLMKQKYRYQKSDNGNHRHGKPEPDNR